jgi:uncharacterized membrane protein YhaH (DUF805 family)
MMRLVLQKSKTGVTAACLYLCAFLGLLAWIFFVASKNPADSGESGILLLPLVMPWVMWLPVEWLGLWAVFLCVSLNALIVYCLFGGLRFKNRV